ncbi:cellulose synthase/poly-beta-1,6-N-acetylglucosamine synthase-like glycosyltransferase [Rhodobacter aestuarii]|uniref:Glycosyltransferase, catalytic subunit of cellulose synthase and poly-beta-1,6-N-acetylglucosamine synthase n=1 Tax=Rhodobacter aestuarii TaxID=453582 RepID=A0A1N7L1Z7_9RHOB|nr:glycosyltransferase family 2 protein [Rhodobacter aestuarii]PTV95431.1 cellulose synthase/poly-beta-1,6-N-acetylglucosamine synthase-like glycosyltransferase [Rhodobacter aestuarii]SIS67883.1 Glycosyltransferase, catalytic subunit of cellulose synthase and poly-beta-1,6-N-acetylglucosamine synthase [Rhodobacter aestuarii]
MAERAIIPVDFGSTARRAAVREKLEAGRSAADTPDQLSSLSAKGDTQKPPSPRPTADRAPLGQILLEMGAVAPGDLLKAIAMRARQDVRLGDILLSHGWVEEAALMAALSRQWRTSVVDLFAQPPDPRLIDIVGPELCLRERMVPWCKIGGVTLIATARPEDFTALRARLPHRLGPFRMVLAPEADVHKALLARRQTALIRRAETKVEPTQSCRAHNEARAARLALGALVALALGLMVMPIGVFGLLFLWAIMTLFATTGLKLAAFLAHWRATRRSSAPQTTRPPHRLPMISIMVPLFQERDIAPRLIARLARLHYPRELLDIVLVVEESDKTTAEALRDVRLPRWIRIVTVPNGPIRTKPRALNYALNFCRGSVVGVYDAEDMPEPKQLHIVARHFAETGPEVACLQGQLDYYNPQTNWLARCFTIEYAAWFRVFLPGLARLGLVVPLGGTTLFFRREALEKLGGWDAHNVTEDADLGIRLARHGYRTELIPTVTHEEANCRPLPWVKQRSRWLKGYAMTWAVHMRNPRQLWRDLGTKRFIGLQILILGSLSQYLLAPLLWSCWAILFGFWHPVAALLSPELETLLLFAFVMTELINIGVGAWAVRGGTHRPLVKWVPTLQFYFALGAIAAWKALYEVITRPFYWDKTAHGLFDGLRHMSAPGLRSPLVAEVATLNTPPEPVRVARAPLID